MELVAMTFGKMKRHAAAPRGKPAPLDSCGDDVVSGLEGVERVSAANSIVLRAEKLDVGAEILDDRPHADILNPSPES